MILIFHKRKGSALLVSLILIASVSTFIVVGAAKVNSVSMNINGSNKLTSEAQEYAIAQANILRSVDYSSLKQEKKASIPNTKFQKEITVGKKSTSDNVTSRDVTVNIYHDKEEHPRSSLTLTRYTPPTEVDGCQIATGTNNVSFISNGVYKSITVISSATFNPADSSWSGNAYYDIRVNGASRGGFNCYTSTQKSGSGGHYWGTTHNVTNQKTVSADIKQGSQISVNLTSSSRLRSSTVTVILGT